MFVWEVILTILKVAVAVHWLCLPANAGHDVTIIYLKKKEPGIEVKSHIESVAINEQEVFVHMIGNKYGGLSL